MNKLPGPRRIENEIEALSSGDRRTCVQALRFLCRYPEIVAGRTEIVPVLLGILGDHPERTPEPARRRPEERLAAYDAGEPWDAWNAHEDPRAIGLAAAALAPAAHVPRAQASLRRAAMNPTHPEIYLEAARALWKAAGAPENWGITLQALRRGREAVTASAPGPAGPYDPDRERERQQQRRQWESLHATLVSALSAYAARPEARDMLLGMLRQSPQDVGTYWYARVVRVLARQAGDPLVQAILVPCLDTPGGLNLAGPAESALSGADLADATIAALIAELQAARPLARARYVRVLARYAQRPDVHAALAALQSDPVHAARNAALAAIDGRGAKASGDLQALRQHLEQLFAADVDAGTAATLAEQCQALAAWVTDAARRVPGMAEPARDDQALGERVRARRAALGLSQAELAEEAGISQPYASRVERGLVSVSIATLKRLAAALETSPAELLEEGPTASGHQSTSGAPAEVNAA